MSTVETTAVLDDDELRTLLEPRDDVVLERPLGGGVFTVEEGPFSEYRRTVTSAPSSDGRHEVTTTIDFRMAVPVWGPLFRPLFKRALRTPPDRDNPPWYLPPDRLDRRASEVLSLLAVFSVWAGYLGVLLSQLNTYMKAEFGSTNEQIAQVLTGTRIAGLLALVVVAFADRLGRRRILLVATYVAVGLTALGALAPDLVWVGVSQTGARAFSAAVGLIVGIMAAEEMPRSGRAFAASMLVMSAALGAGGCVAFLGLADLAPWAWRVFFVIPLLMVWPTIRVARHLPESRRFEVFELAGGAKGEHRREHRPEGVRDRTSYRFAILGATAFLAALFTTPASGFLNTFLREEQGYSGLRITLLQVITNLTGISMLVGGKLADARGRRLIGAVGLAGGFGFTVLMYLSSGWQIWAFSALATLLGAIAVPALAVYGAELFPTGARGTAGGGINVLGVAGSVVGLLVAGRLADHFGSFGPAMAILAVGPALVVVNVLLFYPETAHLELEELNPQDVHPPHGEGGLHHLDEVWEDVHVTVHVHPDGHDRPAGHEHPEGDEDLPRTAPEAGSPT